jgi:hypothetical protein
MTQPKAIGLTTASVDSQYLGGNFGFPSDNIPVEQKDEKWGLQWLSAMYNGYLTSRTYISYNTRNQYMEDRLYGRGQQPVDKYKPMLWGYGTGGGAGAQGGGNVSPFARKGFSNIDFSILNVFAKYKAIVKAKIMAADFDIFTQSVDALSEDERTTAELESLAQILFKDSLEAMSKILHRVDPDKASELDEVPMPKDLESFNVYKESGGFKLVKEIANERLLKSTFENFTNWEQVKELLVEDLIDLAFCVCKDYLCPQTGIIKYKYVDPLNAILGYSREKGFEDMPYGGHIEVYTIQQLKQKCPHILDETWGELAGKFMGYGSNPIAWSGTDNTYKYEREVNGRGYFYDNFMIPVLEGEWISVDSRYKTTRTLPDGTKRYYDEDFGKVYKTEQRKTDVVKVPMAYEGKWIIGTTTVFEFGVKKDMSRDNNKYPRLSYHATRLNTPSMANAARPILDAVQLDWLKLQNAKANAAPAGIAFELGSLANISIGKDGKMSPLDIITMRLQNGNTIYKATTERGKMNMAVDPFRELDGGVGRLFDELIKSLDFNFQLLAEVTGVDRISAVSVTPNKGTGARTTEMARQATDNVLSPLATSVSEVKMSIAKNVIYRTQLLAKYNAKSRDVLRGIIGASGVAALGAMGEKGDPMFGFYMQPKATEQDIAEILAVAMEAMRAGKDGTPDIDMSDYLLIKRMCEAGNLKGAEVMLGFKIAQKQKLKEKNQQQNMQMNGKNMVDTENAKTQGQMAIQANKAKLDIEVDNAKTKNLIKVKAAEAIFANTNAEEAFMREIMAGTQEMPEGQEQGGLMPQGQEQPQDPNAMMPQGQPQEPSFDQEQSAEAGVPPM